LVVCWGDNSYGQTTLPAKMEATQVSAGNDHTCAVQSSNRAVVCWGSNNYRQLTPPTKMEASQVSAGGRHTCALRWRDGLVVCWGDNIANQSAPPAGLYAGRISAGGNHTCASRAADGVTLCWGRNSEGQAPQPYLVTLPTQFGFVGEAFGVYLGDLVGSPLLGSATYAVTGGWLPLGLTLDPGAGVITGTPLFAGDYSFTVTATDGVNFQASRIYRMLIIQIIPA
jgi:hypothetical protein